MSTVASKIRTVTAASAIAAAATLAPAAVAQGSPLTPAPLASIGSTLGGDTVGACDPSISVCAPQVASIVGDSSIQNSLFWFGAANPDFQPLVGIVFPNIFGWDFEACALGGAVRFDPYSGSGFIGLGAGC